MYPRRDLTHHRLSWYIGIKHKMPWSKFLTSGALVLQGEICKLLICVSYITYSKGGLRGLVHEIDVEMVHTFTCESACSPPNAYFLARGLNTSISATFLPERQLLAPKCHACRRYHTLCPRRYALYPRCRGYTLRPTRWALRPSAFSLALNVWASSRHFWQAGRQCGP